MRALLKQLKEHSSVVMVTLSASAIQVHPSFFMDDSRATDLSSSCFSIAIYLYSYTTLSNLCDNACLSWSGHVYGCLLLVRYKSAST